MANAASKIISPIMSASKPYRKPALSNLGSAKNHFVSDVRMLPNQSTNNCSYINDACMNHKEALLKLRVELNPLR
jgi:hypothetical protein